MPSSPVDLAKETLLRLAQLQQPPTPENYTRIYCELAGEPELLPPRLVRLLELVVAKLPRTGERTCAALARASTLDEVIKLQSDFAMQQAKRLADQAKSLGESGAAAARGSLKT